LGRGDGVGVFRMEALRLDVTPAPANREMEAPIRTLWDKLWIVLNRNVCA